MNAKVLPKSSKAFAKVQQSNSNEKSTQSMSQTNTSQALSFIPNSVSSNSLPLDRNADLQSASLLASTRKHSHPQTQPHAILSTQQSLPNHQRFSAEFNAIHQVTQRKRSYDIKSNPIFDGFSFPRRHSMARVHALAVEAPITRVINILLQIQEKYDDMTVKQSIDHAIAILRSTELYTPITLLDNDRHTSALVSGLMSVSSKANKIITVRISYV